MNNSNDDDQNTPLPDFRASGIQLQTVAPALGVAAQSSSSPDYLDYDNGGRGLVVTMFANAGVAYLLGIGAGGLYGIRQGLTATPSNRFRVQLNSVLNHCGRYGSRAGNTLGVFAVLYSLYENLADKVRGGWELFYLLLAALSHAIYCCCCTLDGNRGTCRSAPLQSHRRHHDCARSSRGRHWYDVL